MRAIIDWKIEAKDFIFNETVLLLEQRTRGLLKGLLKVQKQISLLLLPTIFS